MRVVEIITGLGLGGSETALARRLKYQPAGVSTTVINTIPGLDHYSAQVRDHAERLIEIDLSRMSAGSLQEIVRESAADVVVTHSPRETLRLHRSRLPRTIRSVAVVHNSLASPSRHLEWPVAGLLRVINPRISMHIAVSGAAASGHQCLGAKNVAIVPLGSEIDGGQGQSSAWPPDTRVRLLTLSRLFWYKNVHSLVSAMASNRESMRARGVHLCVFGDGDQSANLANAVNRAGIPDLVSLNPAVNNPSSLLRAADALIVPSIAEGGPLTIYEALLAGIRVVSTPVGIAPEILQGDPGLLLAKSFSTSDLGAALRALVEMERLEEAERERRAKHFSYVHTSQTSRDFYAQVENACG